MFAECFAKLLGQEELKLVMEDAQLGHLYTEGEFAFDPSLPLVKEEGRIYLKRNFLFENMIASHLTRIWSANVKRLYILNNAVTILTGGPGTGKSHKIRELIEELPSSMRVHLAAPTGKAANKIGGETLHSLLGVKRPKDLLEKVPLIKADLVIVDECSMIDAGMWAHLFSAIPTGCRLLLVGDPDQLPPVEAGTIFTELVEFAKAHRPDSLIHLTKCYRTDQLEILEMAAKACGGQMIPFETSLGQLDPTWQYLSCVKGGPWGVKMINHLMPNESERLPVMITRNDKEVGLFNGDTGFIEGKWFNKTLPIEALPPYDLAYCLSVHKSQGSEYQKVTVLVPPGSEVFGREILYTAITRAREAVRVVSDEATLKACLERTSRRRSHLGAKLESSLV
ncbi:MAG: RecBCD enzyme subunit RecD [Chlamydiia bacterium]|nr:RecBCD enzyme subunit RecD [Chlamydiia bacterium]MCH9616371.1 RecBCD enzyme subunit RecD [Chlamydiia bacterium]MCH9629643.1 RecBCD enzyme subunit RecD [Chlamydiia bacterium]